MQINKLKTLKAFKEELGVILLHVKENSHYFLLFTDFFVRGCKLLDIDNDIKCSEVFGTSRPNASRWLRGVVIPPASKLVLRFLLEEIVNRINLLENFLKEFK